MTEGDSGNIPTNLRLLAVLEELCKVGVPITPTDVNMHLGLPKPTVHRLFHTLESEGFIQRDIDGRSYGPGPRLRKLSMNVLSTQRVRTVRLTILRALAREVGETCNIATPDREEMIYLDRVETEWPLRIQLPIGTSVPFHCTASGKMYLSSLSTVHFERYLAAADLVQNTEKTMTDLGVLKTEILNIRRNGYSTDAEEFMDGMVAIAVPILDDQSRLMSTLSVHAPTQRVNLETLRSFLPKLSKAASALSEIILTDDMTIADDL